MICFEVSVNGRMLCTAGVGDRTADMAALVCALGGSSEGKGITTSLDVRGAADDVQIRRRRPVRPVASGFIAGSRFAETRAVLDRARARCDSQAGVTLDFPPAAVL